ncbi:MAG: hypothetical protein NUV68_05350 [Caldiserica bacterium]|jgi:hypothetical protein|nr:hypothetical protein [Caldisericota bacterium]MDH7562753.1 hypothetical protein [Caldisericota bacterium]
MEKKFVSLDPEAFLQQAITLVESAQSKGIFLRILGALAVFKHTDHSPEGRKLFFSLGRLGEGQPIFTDLDLIAYSRQAGEVRKFFEREMGFKPNVYVNSIFAFRRNIFHHPEGSFDVDVFYDLLDFSHPVEFGRVPGRGRLEKDFPTISLADIVLEKLQIHQINRKDLIDLLILFFTHEFSESEEKERINSAYIARTLSDSWGFWYDARENLQKLIDFTREVHQLGLIPQNLFQRVEQMSQRLIQRIDDEPKSPQWVKRSKRGTSIPWYKEVEEVER